MVKSLTVGSAALLLITACSSTGTRSGVAAEWRARVDTVGDTIVVHTLTGSVWRDTAHLEPEVSIGDLEGEDAYLFGEVRALAVRDNGEILVLDRQVPALRRYTPDGRYLGDIGREGGGPGEYKQVGALALMPDGRILVRDRGNGRIDVWGPDLEPLPSWRLPAGGTFGTSRPLYVDTAGNSHTLVLLEVGRPPEEWTYGLARYTPEGEHRDTLVAPTWDYREPVVTARREGSSSSRNVPFSPAISWSFSPFGYFVGGLSTEYRVDLFRPEGVLRIERTWDPVPTLAEERQERRRRITEGLERQYGSWRWNGPEIPQTKPPFRDLMVDHDGRVWVLVSRPAAPFRSEAEAREEEERSDRPQLRYREPIVYDVFDHDGRFLGPVVTPEGFQDSPEPVIRGDTLWGVVRGELDVARVMRFRIVHPAGD